MAASAASLAYVQKMFLAYFGRPVAPTGQDYYAGLIDAGNVAALQDDFWKSTESQSKFSALTTEGKVTAIFQQLFGRDPAISGLTYWTTQINSGAVSLPAAALTILNSAAGSDLTIFNAKLNVANAFTAQLDTAAEVTGLQNNTAAAAAVLANIKTTAAATAAIADIVNVVKGVVEGNGGATPGQTFTLTNSTDNFTGTSGNDTFIGDNVSTSAGDTMVGGAGTDTLKLFGTATSPNYSGIENVYLNAPAGDFNVSGKSDVTSLEVDSEALAAARTYTVTTGQAVKLTNITGTAFDLNIAGNTPTSVSVTANGLSTLTGTAVIVDIEGTAANTLSLTATGADSNMVLRNAGTALRTVNVSGDKVIAINGDSGTNDAALTTVDASSMTAGGLRFVADATDRAMTIKGGAGNDRIDIQATLAATDTIDAGTGTDTLRISDGTDLTAASVANVKGFEILSGLATANAATTSLYDASILNGTNNVLSGVEARASGTATDDVAITNISDAAKDNINIVGNSALVGDDFDELTFTVSSFVSGGTSDSATIKLDNLSTRSADGVDVTGVVTFTNVDILTVNSISDGTAAAAEQASIGGLTATDMDKLVVTGNQSVSITTAATTVALTEVDATGLTAEAGQGLTVDTSAGAIAALLVKGSVGVDTITANNAATNAVTVFTGGGSDVLELGVTGATHTLKFNATALNSGDVLAGTAITINSAGTAFQAGDTVTIDFAGALENLLKVGGTVLGTTAIASTNLIGQAFGANTNAIAIDNGNDTVFQIDLNGDGVYSAASDFQITITGLANNTFTYQGATDVFVFTATA